MDRAREHASQSIRSRRIRRRFALAIWLASLSLTANASQAPASVTIGQLAAPSNCGALNEWAQPTVTSGNSYVVPPLAPNLVITSWSNNANAQAGQSLTMKVFRQFSGLIYTAVGHDGPHSLTPNIVNAFTADVAVKPGDVLGLQVPSGTSNVGCAFSVPGETTLNRFANPGLADGESATFSNFPNLRLNIIAVVEPANRVRFGKVTRNRRKGTATLTVKVPNPGRLELSGRGIKSATRRATAPRKLKLLIKAKGNKREKLERDGRVKVVPDVTFTPTGGDPKTRSKKLILKLKLS